MTRPIDPPNVSAEAIRRLVEEVVRRVRAEAARPGVGSGIDRSATPGASGQPEPAQPVSPPAAAPAVGIVLAERVVTRACLERLPAGTRQVTVPAKAVITPSAHDHAREAGIALVRGGGVEGPGAGPPFLVARAECDDRAAVCPAIVRGVAGARQLPATGLVDVLAALETHASRDGGRGILLCGRPALAVIAANRRPGLRAVTGRDAPGLLAAADECAANLLVVDPRGFPAAGLARLCAAFVSRPSNGPPVELAPQAGSCHCQGHASPASPEGSRP
jgi:hypothetical protein